VAAINLVKGEVRQVIASFRLQSQRVRSAMEYEESAHRLPRSAASYTLDNILSFKRNTTKIQDSHNG
jgi:hypothetical protein